MYFTKNSLYVCNNKLKSVKERSRVGERGLIWICMGHYIHTHSLRDVV